MHFRMETWNLFKPIGLIKVVLQPNWMVSLSTHMQQSWIAVPEWQSADQSGCIFKKPPCSPPCWPPCCRLFVSFVFRDKESLAGPTAGERSIQQFSAILGCGGGIWAIPYSLGLIFRAFIWPKARRFFSVTLDPDTGHHEECPVFSESAWSSLSTVQPRQLCLTESEIHEKSKTEQYHFEKIEREDFDWVVKLRGDFSFLGNEICSPKILLYFPVKKKIQLSDPIAQTCYCTSWNSNAIVLKWLIKHKLFQALFLSQDSQLQHNQIRLKLYFEISKILNTTSWIISSPVVGSYLSKTTYGFCTAWFFVGSLRSKGRHGQLRFFSNIIKYNQI